MEHEARTRIIGILNLTPDSFSDGGQYTNVAAALSHVETMLADGAEVIDFGAESTRPNATAITPEEEWQRLGEVLSESVRQFPDAVLSVDTRHAATAEKALSAGAHWINDVSGGADDDLLRVVAENGDCHYVFMHSLGVPADPANTLPEGVGMVSFMHSWARDKQAAFEKLGIAAERLIFDPGIGFGKSAAQSWELVRDAEKLVHEIDVPVLIGHSRKSFLKTLTGDKPAEERDLETHLISAAMTRAGAEYLRVHDVAGAARAVKLAQALAQE